ncbi:hypothetical protein JCM6882_005360 [Rhodosporidiobolus microsporus]
MAAPFAATYVPPAPPLPDWLSYTSSPTATALVPYTVATLLPNGVPTLVTSAARVTQYDTALLQLPITVDSAADVRGIDLGSLYTTAGGTDPTVARELDGTRAFTLRTATRALAGEATTAGGGRDSSAGTTTAGDASAGAASSSSRPGQQATTTRRSPSSTSSNASSDPPTAASATGGTSRTAEPATSAALAVATQASSANPSSVASLRSALSSASAALASASSISVSSRSSVFSGSSLSLSSASLSSANSDSSSSATSTPSSTPPSSPTSSSFPSDSATAAPSTSGRLNALTPSQLAAAIAAPICFFFLLLFLLVLLFCCVRRRKRARALTAADEGNDGEGGEGAPGGAGGGQRGEMEEQGLLGFYAGAGRRPSRGLGSSRRGHKRKITWEWIPARSGTPRAQTPRAQTPRDGDDGGRTSRASGRSVLAALTGGLFGASASAAAAAGPDGALSRRADEEKGEEKEEGGAEKRPPSALSGRGMGAGAGFLAVRSASRASYSPVVSDDVEGGGELQDVDLTSPRLNDDGGGQLAPLPLSDGEDDGEMGRVRSLQALPPIVGTNGTLRLSRYYTPPEDAANPPQPQMYDPFSPSDSTIPTFSPSSPHSSFDSPTLRTPPLALAPPIPLIAGDESRFGPVHEATRSLDALRNDYVYAVEGDVGDTEGGRRDTRLGYLSWSTMGRGSVGTKAPQRQEDRELTPPPTPSDADVPARPVTPSAEHSRPVVSEMGWLSGRWSGLLGGASKGARGSDEEERVGTPDEGEDSGGSGRSRATVASSALGFDRMSSSELFLNRPRWLGNSRSSPPPFTRVDVDEPTSGPPISYDPPVLFHRSHSDPASLICGGGGTDIASVSRYDDTPPLPPATSAAWVRTPSLHAFPDSPLLHSPPIRGVERTHFFPSGPSQRGGKSSFGAAGAGGKRQSGVSVLDRIAASFSSVRSGLDNAGLGIDEGDDERRDEVEPEMSGARFRGGYGRPARSREVSTESATDPFQHTLPARPHTSPTSPPRRPPRDVRRSQLRSSHTTPILFLPKTDAPPLPFIPLSTPGDMGERRRYSDPFEEVRSESGPGEEEGEVVWAGERRPSKAVPDISTLQSVEG